MKDKNMIYITGDKHGNFSSIKDFCKNFNTTINDILIILGDVGLNYFLDERDSIQKKNLSTLPITFLCVHGNHEERPENISTYKTKKFNGGIVYYEEEYPNILFAKDGEVYNFNGNNALVAGGAYSVDKYYRIEKGMRWFKSELPDNKKKQDILNGIKLHNNKIDIILSHTCPHKYIPVETFLPFIDQSKVDNSYELWLDKLLELNCKWYCGHFHIDKTIDNLRFVFNDFIELRNDDNE